MAKFGTTLKRTLVVSSTSPIGTVNAAASSPRRGYLYYWSIGSESAPADVNIEFQMRRATSIGAGGSAPTVLLLDPGDSPVGAVASQGAYTTDPTFTANSDLFREVWNQKYGAKWYAPPGGEIVYPATASNGIGVLTPVCTSGTPLVTFECHVEEK